MGQRRYLHGMAVWFASAWLATVSHAKAPLTLHYAGNPGYPPYHWCLSPTRLGGASVEQLQLIMPPGITLMPLVYPWKRVLLAAEQGQVDIVLPLRINAERARYLRFSRYPAFENPIAVFVRQRQPIRYTGWDSLKGYRGGISLGDVFGDGFDQYLAANLKVETAPDMASNFRKLALGRIDYFITGRHAGLAYLNRHKLATAIIDLPTPVTVSKIHLGFGRRVPDTVIDSIDEALRKMATNGTTTALLRKWSAVYATQADNDCQ